MDQQYDWLSRKMTTTTTTKFFILKTNDKSISRSNH